MFSSLRAGSRGLSSSLIRAIAALVLPAVLAAQVGTLRGRVSGPNGSPVAGAIVQISRDARPVARAVASVDGLYAISNIPEGTYTLVARRIGLAEFSAPDLRIAGETTRDITLAAVSASLDRVVVSASRAPEKVLDAPASVSIVDVQRIEERPSLTIADHLRAQPGVDVSKGGLVQSNIVARGW